MQGIKLYKLTLIIVLFTFIISVKTVSGQHRKEHFIDIELSTCLKDSMSTAAMCNCTIAARQSWDAELNKYYKLLLNSLSEKGKENLKQAQRAWLVFRDNEFKLISTYFYEEKQGTMFYIIAESNKMDIVKQRALDLQDYYNMLDY